MKDLLILYLIIVGLFVLYYVLFGKKFEKRKVFKQK